MPISSYLGELRGLVGSRRLLIPSVAVVMRDGGGRLLLVRDRESGVWGLPAGAVDPGESPRAAARRELREETGWVVDALRLAGAVGGEDFRHRYANGDEVEYQIFVFAAHALDGEGGVAAHDTAEVAEARFFARGEAPPLALPYPDALLWEVEPDGTAARGLEGAGPDPEAGTDDFDPAVRGVRWGRRADRNELVRMRRSLWPDSTAGEVETLLAGEAPPAYRVLVAERGGAGLAGFAEVGERPYAEGATASPVAYLEGIWVDPDRRRSRVGAALLEAAVAWARHRGLTVMGSDAELANLASHRFHRAMGFDEVGRAVCFLREL